MNKIKIYTDGSCLNNPGIGGWAIIINMKENNKIFSGGKVNTTNNSMELNAVYNALRQIEKNEEINKEKYFEIYCDSSYVVNGINENWVEKWISKEWLNSRGSIVKNKRLWHKIYLCKKDLEETGKVISLVKVKGHSGDIFNDIVDSRCREEAMKIKAKQGGYLDGALLFENIKNKRVQK